LFCPAYKGRKFSKRSVDEIKQDIDAVCRIVDLVDETSQKTGYSGSVNQEVYLTVLRGNPDIYGQDLDRDQIEHRQAMVSLNNTVNWMFNGKKRIFLQDANALALRADELIDVLRYIKTKIPSVESVTCYARSKTCSQRSLEELKEIKDAGLSKCFVGIESGSDELLSLMKKGVSYAEHLEGGRNMKEAGIEMAAFVMPGLAGNSPSKSREHIEKTVELLNAIQPAEIRVRSIAILENSQLYQLYQNGEHLPATEDTMIHELQMLLEGIDYGCEFETYQMTNVLFNVKEPLPEQRSQLLEMINNYRNLTQLEQARFRLNNYLYGGYLNFVKRAGRFDDRLDAVIKQAQAKLGSEEFDASDYTEKAIFAIKSKIVP